MSIPSVALVPIRFECLIVHRADSDRWRASEILNDPKSAFCHVTWGQGQGDEIVVGQLPFAGWFRCSVVGLLHEAHRLGPRRRGRDLD